MHLPSFQIARLPAIHFGDGSVAELPELIAAAGRRALLITGRHSFRDSSRWPALLAALEQRGVETATLAVEGEPSPTLVDRAVASHREASIEVVAGIGGGSVLDAAKAIAGLLPHGNSVMDHLEGVGRGIPYNGPALPFIAVPTTAGTGSEATKNAVLSERRSGGFKKSFRHDCLVPRHAVVDPELLASCPRELIAADGMDALTQLIESFTSSRANPLTDALARSGLEHARNGLWRWYDDRDGAADGRRSMAYAALLSGITLAQTGLGVVHGLAAPLGAFYPAPHGLACGTLLAVATEVNIRALEQRVPDSDALDRYARLAGLLTRRAEHDPSAARRSLVELLWDWTERLELPGLGRFALTRSGIGAVVAASRGSSMKTNPVELTEDEIAEILERRL